MGNACLAERYLSIKYMMQNSKKHKERKKERHGERKTEERNGVEEEKMSQ
jgi:hypothetical protein